jgi:hypothetical protein
MRFRSGRHDRLGEQEFAARGQDLVDVAEDGKRPFVLPVVKDPPHRVNVAALRNGLKEIAADRFASVVQAAFGEKALALLDN